MRYATLSHSRFIPPVITPSGDLVITSCLWLASLVAASRVLLVRHILIKKTHT
jgi:hypothetical protein